MTLDSGLEISSYGSYYRLGQSESDGLDFQSVKDTALELGAPVIRIWAGNKSSEDADPEYRKKITEEALKCAGEAAVDGLKIAFEYHRGTLTDTNKSASLLMKECAHSAVASYWQPPLGLSVEERLKGLNAIPDERLSNIHAFQWKSFKDKIERLPLSEGIEEWKQYLAPLRDSPLKRYALIEFVRNDSPEQFLKDAETLARLIKG
jgi:sugar phosphate isomerase/epimerase